MQKHLQMEQECIQTKRQSLPVTNNVGTRTIENIAESVSAKHANKDKLLSVKGVKKRPLRVITFYTLSPRILLAN